MNCEVLFAASHALESFFNTLLDGLNWNVS
jgi:hypothetical protein